MVLLMNNTASYETTTRRTWIWDGCSFECEDTDDMGLEFVVEVTCEDLHTEFAARLEAMDLIYAVESSRSNTHGERDQQRFLFDLGSCQGGALSIRGEWQCGSGVALHAYLEGKVKTGPGSHFTGRKDREAAARKMGGLTIHDDTIRKEIRIAYKPSASEIISSLISDDQSIDGYSDFLDWADDMGVEGSTALREARTNFALIQERAPKLRTILGSDFENLQRIGAGL